MIGIHQECKNSKTLYIQVRSPNTFKEISSLINTSNPKNMIIRLTWANLKTSLSSNCSLSSSGEMKNSTSTRGSNRTTLFWTLSRKSHRLLLTICILQPSLAQGATMINNFKVCLVEPLRNRGVWLRAESILIKATEVVHKHCRTRFKLRTQ